MNYLHNIMIMKYTSLSHDRTKTNCGLAGSSSAPAGLNSNLIVDKNRSDGPTMTLMFPNFKSDTSSAVLWLNSYFHSRGMGGWIMQQ